MRRLNMYQNKTPGTLITFCGLDGCGKTTMIKRLVSMLEAEHPVCLTKQPTDFVRKSDIFRTYMDSPDHSAFDYRSLSLLAASDRVQHTNKIIAPEMQSGKIVISDRYFYSCLANLHARGYTEDAWIYEISESIVKPDLAFFLDVPVEVALQRVRSRPEEKDRYIDVELQHRLREEYQEICKANDGILLSTEETPEDTFYRIWSTVKHHLRNNCNCGKE